MIFNCVEPAHDNVVNRTDYYDWKYTLRRGFGHHVAFPHVDSCLGVVCELNATNNAFAGHINGFYNNDYSANSHRAACTNLVAQMGGAGVNRAVVFGDLATWRGMVNIQQQLNCNAITYLITPQAQYANGFDILFDVDGGNVNVMAYQNGRNFKAGGGVRHAVNLYAVAGVNDVNCP